MLQSHAARATRTGRIERTSAGENYHAAAEETPQHRPRKRVETENGTGRRTEPEAEQAEEQEKEVETEIVIGIGTIAYCTKKQNFQPKREPGEIGNQTAPKNGNPNQPRKLYAPKNNYGAKLCKITKYDAIYLYNIPSCEMTLYLLK